MTLKQEQWVDVAYQKLPDKAVELDHAYGPNVHIVADAFLLTHLAFLCEENTIQPAINTVVRDLYQSLIKTVLTCEFPRITKSFRTRMASSSPRGVWTGQVLDPNIKTVTVNILRAGSVPSQICYDYLNRTLDPHLVRQDYLVMSRQTDEAGRVTGTYLGDSKIGGPVDDSFVLFPDPMGATGSSICEAIRFYKNKVDGKARKYISLNLIVTPQYIRRIREEHPDVVIYALRVDRGVSSPEVLSKRPGEQWQDESGLSEKDYIVPGGGGFGEILNNSYC